MIFCLQCNFVGKPLTLAPEHAVKGQTEVCPNCKNADKMEVYIDEAAAHHAQAHHNKQQAAK